MALHVSDGSIVPSLEKGADKHERPAPLWWTQMVMAYDGECLTRKEIVLVAANKDGGAHVDDELPAKYKRLVKGYYQTEDGRFFANHNALCLRQMGYEMLNSPKLLALTGK
jgi:hypothetical protein